MTAIIPRTLGIDISKDRLDVHLLPEGTERQYANDASGLRELIRWLEPLAPARIVYEATGAYHRLLERMLGAKGLPLVKMNPQHTRAFAKAAGRLSKTDRIDAAMLARFGALMTPQIRPIRTDTLDTLCELVAARRALIKDRTATLNRQKSLTIPLLKHQAEQRLKQIAAQIAAINTECRTRMPANSASDAASTFSTAFRGSARPAPSPSSPTCPNWVHSKTSKLQAWPVLPPSTASPACGRARASSGAAGKRSGRHSTCPHSSPLVSISLSRQNTKISEQAANPQK